MLSTLFIIALTAMLLSWGHPFRRRSVSSRSLD